MTEKSGKYRIRKINHAEHENWDRFVSVHPDATLFQTTAWGRIVESVFKRKFECLIILQRDNSIKGGLLYFPKNIPAFHTIPRAPLTAYQSLLIKPPTSEKASSSSAVEHELTNHILENLCNEYHYIDLTLVPGIHDTRPFTWHKFQAEPVYSYSFLITPYEQLSKQFNQSLRRKIKLSAKENHKIRESEDTDKLLKFISDSYHYHGIKPPVPTGKIGKLVRLCIRNNCGKLYYLIADDEPAAALFVLFDKNRLYALFSGIDLKFRNKQYTEFLHAAVLQLPEYQGKFFDFLGANTPDFEQFKRSFGGELKQSFHVIYYKNMTSKLLIKLRERQHLFSRRVFGAGK
ncbi:MAG: GNAT family N-acetyltransferase [Calditrichaceae bacterium]